MRMCLVFQIFGRLDTLLWIMFVVVRVGWNSRVTWAGVLIMVVHKREILGIRMD